MATPREASVPRADPNLVYVNGIDIGTGNYVFAPQLVEDLAKYVLVHPSVGAWLELHAERPRSFNLPFGMGTTKLDEAGWGIIFHEDMQQYVRDALEPLINTKSPNP